MGAEVLAYFRRFDEAEMLYLKMESKDLAIELRTRLGDWFRVVQLIQTGAGDDALLTTAFSNIGDYYADRQKWSQAFLFYSKAKNIRALVHCAYLLEDYTSLEKYIHQIPFTPEGERLLNDVAEKFMSVGLCTEAVTAFLRAQNVKAAVDCCVLLNQWDQAVELAESHHLPQIEGLLAKYANYLLERNKVWQAIELYRKAHKNTEAARLLSQLAKEAATKKQDPMRAKKLFVLAALEVDRFRRRVLDNSLTVGASAQSTMQTMQALITHDTATGQEKNLDMAWRGAEAYHFLILAQRQLYAGAVDAAMKTSLRLAEYEDILEPKEIFSLIALTSLYNKFYSQCSRAFIKLETLEDAPTAELEQFQQLAVNIFVRNRPEDPATRDYKCPNNKCAARVKDWYTSCPDCGDQYAPCMVTGRPILNNEFIVCRECKHRAYAREIRTFRCCPLCHAPLGAKQQP
eukprot:TRINITY_DN7948_c0_g1_i9.p1 TRINITY_DN7948_c0_g1~~TRINITY_DN7948_c0_g1_i9.p1  ORF type:complete len:468 (-),score=115.61 TRINITY_DN7948_c0_g1_i9:23-1399(-)